MTSVLHLARRLVMSLSTRAPTTADEEWALSHLLPGEAALWRRMSSPDRRHSIVVARRFVGIAADAQRAQVAGALLHDVGKLAAGLGTFERVVATVIGPRTTRFRAYHDHERLGAEMLTAAGSAAATIELVEGRGEAGWALRRADDI